MVELSKAGKEAIGCLYGDGRHEPTTGVTVDAVNGFGKNDPVCSKTAHISIISYRIQAQ